jgi:hypothetical protein
MAKCIRTINLQMQENSMFVSQIEDAMRPLIGIAESSEIKRFGLQQADGIYDRLFPHRRMGNGVPEPGWMTKGQAIAEAFAFAWKHLQPLLFNNALHKTDLEMADFLLREGYKDPAAMIGGGVLEKHLRQLCIKHGIDVERVVNGQTQKKRADQLSNELVGMDIYSTLEQKHVQAWLDLRNKAAHTEYDMFTKEQVSLLLQGIRDFISQYPL